MALAKNRDRLKALIGVAAFHALLGYALIAGLAYQVTGRVSDPLKVFDITEPPPPPPEEPEPAEAAPKPEGEAAPPSTRAVVAPPPQVRIPRPPVPTAPAYGTSPRPGPGSGSGGVGTGTGSGGSGSGTGGGGGARAQRIAGGLDYEDLPGSARRRGLRGTVGVSFVVETNGRVSGCRVTRSSGYELLDGTTCRLIERRFRYRPARDSSGTPISSTVNTAFEWRPD